MNLHVAGARRPLSALLDSGATNNFLRASCLLELSASHRALEGPGEMVVKVADGMPPSVPRGSVKLSYEFNGFCSLYEFLTIEMNYAFDCIPGMPWMTRYQPKIEWLSRSVKCRGDYDVARVYTHLLVAPREWPHVVVVDSRSTTASSHRASDGPLCEVCAKVTWGHHAHMTMRQLEAPR